MKKLIVRLSKSTNYCHTVDLTFDLIHSSFLPKWIDRFLEAQQRQDSISEPWAFYNCGSDAQDENVKDLLNEQIDYCNKLHPRMFERKLENINDQDCLNYIHSVFELSHGKLDEWLSNPIFKIPEGNNLRHSLSQINQLVHKCEAKQTKKSPKIRVVWFDLPKNNTFSENDYKLFTNDIDFGGVYTLYADVGKNLESLACDNDQHVHDFVPNLHYSADFHVRFHDRDGAEAKKKYKEFLQQNLEYFTSLGYSENDPRLTTGHIKIAQLRYTDRQKVLDTVNQYNCIQSVFIL